MSTYSVLVIATRATLRADGQAKTYQHGERRQDLVEAHCVVSAIDSGLSGLTVGGGLN